VGLLQPPQGAALGYSDDEGALKARLQVPFERDGSPG
jgi:hypothetical protein